MPEIDIPKATFNQVVKSPTTYMLIVAVSLVWVFVWMFSTSTDKVNKNCEEEKKQLRSDMVVVQRERDSERNKNEVLTTSLLVKNGIIDGIKQKTDSVVREKNSDTETKIIK